MKTTKAGCTTVRIGVHMTNQEILDKALAIVQKRMATSGLPIVDSSQDAKNLAKLRLAGKDQEEFLVLFLDNQYRYIKDEVMFRGGPDSATVSPRLIAKRCIEYGASAIICSHNHPSGCMDVSRQDKEINVAIQGALDLIDARLIDHILVGESVLSMVEECML